MRTRWIVGIAVTTACVGFWAGSGFTEDKMDHEEMMKKWMQIHQPGPHQKHLASFAGDFDVDQTMYMGGEAKEGKAKSSAEMIYGDRILAFDYKSNWDGMPFEGRGFMAFDNMKKKVQSVWISNMGTGIMWSEGTMSDDGKTLTLHGTHDTPAGSMPNRMVWTCNADGTLLLESWTKMGDKEMKDMSMRYNRSGSAEGGANR